MTTTVSLGLVEATELRRIFDLLFMLRMEGKELTHITVYCADNKRQWLITTDTLNAVITGDTAQFEGAYNLPLTLLANAGRHQAASGDVTFTITNNMVSAESSLGTQTIPCNTVPIPSIKRVASARWRATAELGGKELHHVIFSGANSPFEAGMSDDENNKNPDHFMISIEAKRLVVSSDWSNAKLYLMSAATPAITRGSGQVKVDPDFLSVVFNCVDHDSTWKISFDPKQPHEIVLESDTQYLVAKMTLLPAAKLHERVIKVLEHEQFEFQTAANGVIGMRHDGVTVSLDFFEREDDESPMVRLSTIITRQANESSELLREINDHNKSGVLTRLWFADSAVHFAIDLMPDNLTVLASRLRHLVKEAKRLSGVLDPFAAEPALAPARPKRRRRTVRKEQQPEVW